MVTAISASFIPAIVSSGIFMARRLNKGVDNMETSPMYGCMNLGIGAAQGLKTFKALDGFASVSHADSSAILNYIKDGYKNLAESSKLVSGAGKTLSYATDIVNPLIILAGGVKVLSADDKTDALARESLALGAMFGSEALAKNIFGMTSASRNILTGSKKIVTRTPLHKKLSPKVSQFIDKNVAKFCEVCKNTKIMNKISLAPVPYILRGLAFVGFSIGGYKIGEAIGNAILGKKTEYKKSKKS